MFYKEQRLYVDHIIGNLEVKQGVSIYIVGVMSSVKKRYFPCLFSAPCVQLGLGEAARVLVVTPRLLRPHAIPMEVLLWGEPLCMVVLSCSLPRQRVVAEATYS